MNESNWSEKYAVLARSRLDVQSLGLSHEQVKRLTEEDLQALADILADHYYTKAFLTTLMCTALTILGERKGEGVYTKERLIALNASYHIDHRVTDGDVETINTLVGLIELMRHDDDPQSPVDGDRIMCISPKRGVVSRTGHIQRRMCFSDWMTICTQPYTPFIDERLESDASGGYWVSVWKRDIPLFTFVGKELKTFCAWGHMGMTRNGAIDFQAEVFIWEFTHPSFY